MEINSVLEKAAEKISKKYKISKEETLSFLKARLEKTPFLKEAVSKQPSLEKVERLSVYKAFVKEATKDIYYSLRQYHRSVGLSEEGHISTRERKPFEKEFFEKFISICPNAETILDVGGGVFPLTFPFDNYPSLKRYVWVDKDKRAYELLKEQDNPKLALFNESIGARPWKEYFLEGQEEFGLALMLKLVSVVKRQERRLLPILAKVPARNILITAPKEAMTKREDVRHREEKIIRDFISLTGREIIGTLDIENEFGYLLQ